MPAKRSLWAKGTINFNYLINTIHLWASRVIPLARASGTVVEKRDSANLSNCAIFGMVILLKIGSGYFTHIAYSVPKLGFVHCRFINNPAPDCQILMS
jgi:hypothetical protein